MRVRKTVNRVHKGTTYYRWVVSIPPKDIRELGWVDGQELRAVVQGATLSIEPLTGGPSPRRSKTAVTLDESVLRKSLPQAR